MHNYKVTSSIILKDTETKKVNKKAKKKLKEVRMVLWQNQRIVKMNKNKERLDWLEMWLSKNEEIWMIT
mgnify:CR=1 FL=1